MAESWFKLNRSDQREALETVAGVIGRPAHLLEKDIWVVWTLAAIYETPLGADLTFKGGTSLSKVYRIIDRFSEDIDLTYDIRQIVPDLLKDGNPIPSSTSQAKKLTDAVKNRLPNWIRTSVQPVLTQALQREELQAELSLEGSDQEKLILEYEPIHRGTGYVAPRIQLEFGARATGEPNQRQAVTCDLSAALPGIAFPTATPLVMQAERTFWEKATAAHVYCHQGRLRGERYSRHWYDLAAMHRTGHAQRAIADNPLALAVAQHKSMFFAENDADRNRIDYHRAVGGAIQLVPEGAALDALRTDYAAMLSDGLIAANPASFDEIIGICTALQRQINTK